MGGVILQKGEGSWGNPVPAFPLPIAKDLPDWDETQMVPTGSALQNNVPIFPHLLQIPWVFK